MNLLNAKGFCFWLSLGRILDDEPKQKQVWITFRAPQCLFDWDPPEKNIISFGYYPNWGRKRGGGVWEDFPYQLKRILSAMWILSPILTMRLSSFIRTSFSQTAPSMFLSWPLSWYLIRRQLLDILSATLINAHLYFFGVRIYKPATNNHPM